VRVGHCQAPKLDESQKQEPRNAGFFVICNLVKIIFTL
jgi:hypothetical protein